MSRASNMENERERETSQFQLYSYIISVFTIYTGSCFPYFLPLHPKITVKYMFLNRASNECTNLYGKCEVKQLWNRHVHRHDGKSWSVWFDLSSAVSLLHSEKKKTHQENNHRNVENGFLHPFSKKVWNQAASSSSSKGRWFTTDGISNRSNGGNKINTQIWTFATFNTC